MSRHPVRIIGAGIGGLTLGRCLLKHGVPAILYEKKPSPPRHDYGVTLHPSSYRPLLDILGLEERAFRHRIAVDASVGGAGNIDSKLLSYPDKIESSSSFRAHCGRLEELLRQGLDIQWDHAVDNVENSASGMTLCLQVGQKLETSCMVGCDGPHSTTRRSLSPEATLDVLPYVAFNGSHRVARDLFDSVFAPAMGVSSVIETKQGDTVLNVSVSEQKEDSVSLSWIYSRSARGSSDPLHRPNRSTSAARETPKEFFEEIKALQDLQQPFKNVFDAERLRGERILHWLMRTSSLSHQELRAHADKGVIFLGDSTHAEPILGGNGANNAITDGIGLAKVIAESGLGGVQAWYDEVCPRWEKGVKQSEITIREMHSQHWTTML